MEDIEKDIKSSVVRSGNGRHLCSSENRVFAWVVGVVLGWDLQDSRDGLLVDVK